MPFNLSGFNASGPCGCCGNNFSYTFTVVGCANPAKNAAFFSGLTVSVYTSSGGTLLASGTTNSSGQVTLSWSDSAGPNTRYVTASTPWTGRNDAYGANRSLSNGGGATLALPANASYACCSNVDWAIPKTLYWTDADGTYTLTNSGGTVWSVLANMAGTASGVVCFSCASATINPMVYRTVGCGSTANLLGVTRQWYTKLCSGSFYYIDSTGCGTGSSNCDSSANYDTSGGPPFSFSGTLSFRQCNGVGQTGPADPISGTATITE